MDSGVLGVESQFFEQSFFGAANVFFLRFSMTNQYEESMVFVSWVVVSCHKNINCVLANLRRMKFMLSHCIFVTLVSSPYKVSVFVVLKKLVIRNALSYLKW